MYDLAREVFIGSPGTYIRSVIQCVLSVSVAEWLRLSVLNLVRSARMVRIPSSDL